ncbi:hypothetical protein BDR06DRAFT_888191 [Suillus hirtellus]|nr:hypothetical protein BDR06DRAFT_888191 [Suillus hirtellus]
MAPVSTQNVVIFGEVGAGKSSVINLMAGQEIAPTSSNLLRCTLHWVEYQITLKNGSQYNVFDMVGLQEAPCLQVGEYLSAITNAYSLINTLKECGGINLLLFCIRAGKVAACQENYRLFFKFLCEKKVLLALVITNLERERRMEDWYMRNRSYFDKCDIRSVGHACITTANLLDRSHGDKYEESCRILRKVVEVHCNASMDSEGWAGVQ